MLTDSISVFDVDASTAPDTWGFRLDDFSRFKHGSTSVAKCYARLIVDQFEAIAPDAMYAETLTVTGSCYKYVPLASVTLAQFVAHLINVKRAAAQLEPVTMTQLYRGQLLEGDYSSMSTHRRQEFIDQDRILGDRTILSASPVLVVDDVRITGFHEQLIQSLLTDLGTPQIIFAYLASLTGHNDPSLERQLNTASIASVADLSGLIASEDFQLNSRVVKLILSANPADRARFLTEIPTWVLNELAAGVASNGYANMPTYHVAYQQIREEQSSRSLKEAG